MANILSEIDFKGKYFIDFSNSVTLSDFNDNYLPQIEAKWLNNALGSSLSADFLAGLNVVSPATPAQKWLDLRDGANFDIQHNGKTITLNFAGIKELLKKLVWVSFQADKQVEYSAIGAKLNTSDNTERANNLQKIKDVYNEAILNNYGFNVIGECLGASNIELLENYDYKSYVNNSFYTFCLTTGSLYNFIYHKEKATPGTYPNWCFTSINTSNEL